MTYPYVSKANEYIEGVLSGEIPACEYIHHACQRQKDDLKRWKKEGPYRFDYKRAERPCKFLERLPHTKGKWAARQQKIKLEPWQCFWITTLFGWVGRESGFRRFTDTYIEIPRKNAKSTTAAGIGDYMLCADDEYGAEVYAGATSERQAWEVFRPAKDMAKRTPDLLSYYGLEPNASNLFIESTGSKFEPIIGKPGDGASPSCYIADEYHEHKSDEQVATMETGMGARDQPLSLKITTAGDNTSVPCYESRLDAIKTLSGTLENERLFILIYTIDEGDDWTDIETIRKANPNFGVSVNSGFLENRLKESIQSPRKQAAFKTKHLNQWVGSRNAWMNMEEWWKAPERAPLESMTGPCYVALDLNSKVDIAALVAVFPSVQDNAWNVYGRYYLPEDSADNYERYRTWANQGYLTLTPGNVTDFNYIMDDLRGFMSRYDVREVPYDPWNATHFANIMTEEGAPMVEYRPTVLNFSEPMKEVEAMVLRREIAHGNCPVLGWMASNVTAKLDAKENIYPRKENENDPRCKIDGIIALIMGIARARARSEETITSPWEDAEFSMVNS